MPLIMFCCEVLVLQEPGHGQADTGRPEGRRETKVVVGPTNTHPAPPRPDRIVPPISSLKRGGRQPALLGLTPTHVREGNSLRTASPD